MSALERLLDLPVRRPAAVLVATALLTLGLGFGLSRLRVDSSIESMIVEHDPDRLAFEAWKQRFGSDEVVAIALPFDDALSAAALDVQRRIATRLLELPEIDDVDALVTADDIVGEADLLDVRPLVPEDRSEWTPEALASLRERVDANPLWTGFLISRDRRTAALQVRLRDPGGESAERTALVAEIERIAREEGAGAPYFLAGHPFMKTEIARTMQRDLGVFLPVTVGVMALLVWVAVGSLAMMLLVLGTVLVAVVWMTGFMGWVGQPITALSNTGPTFLLAVGCAYVMHLAASYQRLAASGTDNAQAVKLALDRVRRPVVVAGLTTAIGSLFVATSDLPLVRGFGIDLCAGVIAVIALSCFAIPAALTLWPIRGRGGLLTSERRFGLALFHVVRWVAARPRPVLVGAVLLLLASALASSRIVVDSSGPRAFDEDSRFRRSSEFYRSHFSGDVIENVYLRAPAGSDFHDPDRLRRMLAFQRAAEALPEIDKSISIANYLEMMNRAMHGDDPAALALPDSAEAVAQYLLLHSSAGEADEFDDLLDFEHHHARIVLTAAVASSRESAALRAKLEALAREHLPQETGPDAVLSTEILLSEAADELALEQVWSLGGAVALILLLACVAFRSLWIGAHLFLPIGLPVALNFAVMALCGVTLRDVTSVIAVTTLGIAVDSTVHLLDTVRGGQAACGSRRAAVLEAFVTTGRPLVVTSLIIASGLAVLGLSDFQVIANFGGLEALGLLFALAADLIVLPAQLLWSSPARRDESGLVAGEPVLLAGESRVFPAQILAHQGDTLRLRVLGEREPGAAGYGERLELRELGGARPVAVRVTAVEAQGSEIELALSREGGADELLDERAIAALFQSTPGKEFRIGGYRFRRADSIEERQAAYALRFQVYAAQGYIDPGDYGSPILRDGYDEAAIQCLAYDADGTLVGAARVVLPGPLGLQTEALFAFDGSRLPRERTGEIGRLALLPAHRGSTRVAAIGLIKLLWDALREHELGYAVAFMPPALIASLASLGFESERLPVGAPTPDMLRRRAHMPGYFEQNAPEPVFFDLARVARQLGA